MKTTLAGYDLAVLGSSLAGLGAAIVAAEAGQRVLLIEAGTIAGYEFVEALQMHRGWAVGTGASAAARAVHAEATRRKIIREDSCDTAAFSCLLQDRLFKSGAQALYMTDLVGLKQMPSGFAVQISNRSGIATHTASRLIDATPESVALRSLSAIASEKPATDWVYRALLISMEKIEQLPTVNEPNLRLFAGRYGTDAVLELTGTSGDPGIAAARLQLIEQVAKLRTQAAWKNYTLGTTANRVAGTPRYELKPGALAAFEAAGGQVVAGWRTPAVGTAPWTAFDAGAAASLHAPVELLAAR